MACYAGAYCGAQAAIFHFTTLKRRYRQKRRYRNWVPATLTNNISFTAEKQCRKVGTIIAALSGPMITIHKRQRPHGVWCCELLQSPAPPVLCWISIGPKGFAHRPGLGEQCFTLDLCSTLPLICICPGNCTRLFNSSAHVTGKR